MRIKIFSLLLAISIATLSFSGNKNSNSGNSGTDATSASANSGILNSQISINPFGNYIRVWKGTKDTRNPNGFHAQKFYRDGSLNGKELVLAPTVRGDVKNLAVAMNIPGEYFITWETASKGKSGLYGAFFESNSLIKGNDFLIQTSSSAAQILTSDAAMDNIGNATVTWVTDMLGQKNIFAQQIRNYGETVANPFQLNSEALAGNCISKVAVNNASGDFVVAWSIFNGDKNSNEIFAQRYDRDGNKIGNQMLIEQGAATKSMHFDLTLNNKGNLMVIWECETMQGDLKTTCLNGKIFDSAGNVLEDKFVVNSEFDNQFAPTIRCDIKGGFVVASNVPNNTNKQEVVFTVDAAK